MRLEPKPALQATLYLVLWGGLIVLIILLVGSRRSDDTCPARDAVVADVYQL
jgi:hypothetical protein